jgi:hypothetical protein
MIRLARARTRIYGMGIRRATSTCHVTPIVIREQHIQMHHGRFGHQYLWSTRRPRILHTPTLARPLQDTFTQLEISKLLAQLVDLDRLLLTFHQP